MHSNVHYAVGVIIASVYHFFFSTFTWIDLIYFLLIIIASIIADADFFLSPHARDSDHRNFFTHSVFPPIIIILCGVPVAYFWNIHVVWAVGIAYGSHIFLDTLDWRTRLFYGKRQFGFAFLISQDEKNLKKTKIQLLQASGMDPISFFTYRYFRNIGMTITGASLSIGSFLLMFWLAPQYWYVFIGYFLLLEIYLYRKRKMEEKYEDYEEPDTF